MGDIKPVSFRINEEDTEKFKQFASENGLNQAEAFTSIMQTVEISRAKGQIKDRAKEIEIFQDTINNLTGMFINSLAVNQTSEERIREQLSLELNTKDQTIKDLQEERNNLKSERDMLNRSGDELAKNAKEISIEKENLKKELLESKSSLEQSNKQIATLNSIVAEYKEYKDSNVKLDKSNKELLAENNNLNNNIMELQGKLKNADDMSSFYKEQLENQKEEIKDLNKSLLEKDREHKADIKTLENKQNKEIENIKNENRNTLEKVINEYEKKLEESQIQFNNKLDLEIQKKELEIEKLKNKIEQLNKDVIKPNRKVAENKSSK